jgi:coproporphyrinogen III oxidase-like Fe-S oxidoreductase
MTEEKQPAPTMQDILKQQAEQFLALCEQAGLEAGLAQIAAYLQIGQTKVGAARLFAEPNGDPPPGTPERALHLHEEMRECLAQAQYRLAEANMWVSEALGHRNALTGVLAGAQKAPEAEGDAGPAEG